MCDMTADDTPVNRRKVKGWMNLHCNEFDNSTTAAEQCADALDLYEDDIEYVIPEWVFEVTAEYYETL